MVEKQFLYRASNFRTGGYHIDVFGEMVSGGSYHNQITFSEFEVLKETPKGYWILIDFNPETEEQVKRWVQKSFPGSKKRFAYETKEQAVVGYIKRTETYIGILEAKIESSKDGLAAAKSYLLRHK